MSNFGKFQNNNKMFYKFFFYTFILVPTSGTGFFSVFFISLIRIQEASRNADPYRSGFETFETENRFSLQNNQYFRSKLFKFIWSFCLDLSYRYRLKLTV